MLLMLACSLFQPSIAVMSVVLDESYECMEQPRMQRSLVTRSVHDASLKLFVQLPLWCHNHLAEGSPILTFHR